MPRRIKKVVLQVAGRSGFYGLLLNSPWRRRRLLILCYHGVSRDDEHLWDSSLYMEPAVLRRRLEYLAKARCNVIGLDDAVRRLYDGSLPPRAVVITFDDGFHDFQEQAFPLLREFGFPATVYLTTYYSEFNRPVFDPMVGYLAWKGRGRRLVFPPAGDEPIELDDHSCEDVARNVRRFARREGLSGLAKDELLGSLAEALGIDYEELCRRRILHLMTPAEARRVAAGGIALELHTHRHRVSEHRESFLGEIEDNRRRIKAISGAEPFHFCYPGGFLLPEFPVWLRESGVRSATTCEPGICTRHSSPWLLPRVVDGNNTTMSEFGAWVTGFAALVPKRRRKAADWPLQKEP
jgi:peptidoglycan/xylan/chitin deacetylase (PgdA/CDA1 family)